MRIHDLGLLAPPAGPEKAGVLRTATSTDIQVKTSDAALTPERLSEAVSASLRDQQVSLALDDAINALPGRRQRVNAGIAGTVNLYLDAGLGSDGNDGLSMESALRSLDGLLLRMRRLDIASGAMLDIYFAAGEYSLSRPDNLLGREDFPAGLPPAIRIIGSRNFGTKFINSTTDSGWGLKVQCLSPVSLHHIHIPQGLQVLDGTYLELYDCKIGEAGRIRDKTAVNVARSSFLELRTTCTFSGTHYSCMDVCYHGSAIVNDKIVFDDFTATNFLFEAHEQGSIVFYRTEFEGTANVPSTLPSVCKVWDGGSVYPNPGLNMPLLSNGSAKWFSHVNAGYTAARNLPKFVGRILADASIDAVSTNVFSASCTDTGTFTFVTPRHATQAVTVSIPGVLASYKLSRKDADHESTFTIIFTDASGKLVTPASFTVVGY